MIDLGPAAGEVVRLLDHVADDQLDGPTPCPEYNVAALLDHLMGLSLAFAWAARKTTAEHRATAGAPRPVAANLDPQWRTVLPHRLRDMVEAWRDPAGWDGMTEAGGVRLPGEVAGVVALDELVMHGWDLARATGQPFHCDPASAVAVLEFTGQAAQPDRGAPRSGIFGPVVPVPADAPALDRALGFAGRDPAWSPA